MQLDNTRIVIRERIFVDILDLSLHVIRAHALPLAATLAVGIAPAAMLNYWLLSGMLDEAELVDNRAYYGYLFVYLLLVVWEAPVATALATLYLGQASFVERPEWRLIVRNFVGSLPQLFVYQVLLRALLTPWIITWFMFYSVWPNLNEIILLERNPWRKRDGRASSFSRSSALHARNLPDLFAHWLISCAVGTALFLSVWLSLIYLRELVAYREAFDQTSFTVYLPLSLWSVIGYFTVVRFLGYLDLRIRTEGWEVELQMRAEAARLSSPWGAT